MRDLETRFVALYEAAYTDLVKFAARRSSDPTHAEDIAAESFAIAWRRSVDLPRSLGESRAWLFGIARNLLMAKHRHERALPVRICDPLDLTATELGHENTVVNALDLVAAWGRLTAVHQEALSLTVWEGLTGSQAATVLSISPVAYRIRLSRARKALAGLMAVAPRPHHELLTPIKEGRGHEH